MCICTLTSHSTHTACPCAIDLWTQPFALENCVTSCISWSLGVWQQSVSVAKLIRITRELCSPRLYQSAAPVVVNTSVSSRASLCQLNSRRWCIFQFLKLDVSFCWRFQTELWQHAQMCILAHRKQTTHHRFSLWADIQDVSSTKVSIHVMGSLPGKGNYRDHSAKPGRTGFNRAEGKRRKR